jgi:LPXTG-motif cell wall-anchored protein
MKRTIVAAVAMLILIAGTALAITTPGTMADYLSSRPLISGTVVSVNDHQMVVDTDQGEQVTLEVDWRTMAPRDLAPGMVMRAEFLALEDCRFYAQRITAIQDGLSTQRLQAYANTRDSDEAIAHSVAPPGNYGGTYARQASMNQFSAAGRDIPQQSASNPGRIVSATPTTADYQFSTHPMISGRVFSVNDHQLVVDTYQGQQVGMVMDSRTLVPGRVAPGTFVHAEFASMKDGRYYAKRISPISSGVASREQAFAHTRDSDAVMALNTTDCGCCMQTQGAMSVNTEPPAVERREVVAAPEPVAVQEAPAPVVEEKTLPQTASNQPLIALLGLLALGAAGALMLTRRPRSA